MDTHENYIELGKAKLKLFKYSTLNNYNPQELKSLNLSKGFGNHIAIAKLGGPCALLSKTPKQDSITFQNICIFDSTGKLRNRIPFKCEERVVCFDFIEDELILVILITGEYYLVNPFNGHYSEYNLDLENNII